MPFDIYKCFLPECFLDTTLVEVLLSKPHSVNHNKGNSNVIRKIMSSKMLESFAVGIIDEDKRKAKGIDSFNLVKALSSDELKLYKHPEKQHYLIQICPAIERWIINEGRKAKIEFSQFDLLDDLDFLRKMKGLTQRNDRRFVSLFREMEKNEECEQILRLKKWLIFFRDHNYKSNIELLING